MRQPYTHLLPLEVPIWERFLAAPPVEFIRFDYDVHLGKGIELAPDVPEYLKTQAAAVTRKRCDVVAETSTELWIIEIKPRGGMSALGQLITYRALYETEYKPTKPIRLVLVCERLEADVEETLAGMGVTIYVV